MQNNRIHQIYSVWTNPVVVVWYYDGLIADGKNCVVVDEYPDNRL